MSEKKKSRLGSKPEMVTVTVHDLNNLGCGVARMPAGSPDEGLVVFVKGTVTGDVAKAQIIKRTKSFCVGKLLEIVTPSPMRAEEEFCSAPEACGGCVYRHLKHSRVEKAFRQVGLADVTIRPVLTVKRNGEHVTRGYRNKGMYPVRQGKGGMEAGFFAAKTHKVIPCFDCALQPDFFGELVRAVCKLCDKYRVTAYDEETGKGTLRHIYLRSAADGTTLLTLVINEEKLPKPAADGLVHELVGRFPALCGILLNINRENTNVVLGDRFVTLWGRDYIDSPGRDLVSVL